MAKYGFILFVTTFLVAVTLNEVNALKCYRCSTDSSNSDFCDDTFDAHKLNDAQKKTLVDCDFQNGLPINIPPNTRSVCKKLKQSINGKMVTSRSCFWEDIADDKNECKHAPAPSYVSTKFCETCLTDGCNGASEFGPIVVYLLVPLAIARILAL